VQWKTGNLQWAVRARRYDLAVVRRISATQIMSISMALHHKKKAASRRRPS
jgi:hypothetical protein